MGVAWEITGYCFIVNVIAVTGRVSLPALLCPNNLGDSAHAILVKFAEIWNPDHMGLFKADSWLSLHQLVFLGDFPHCGGMYHPILRHPLGTVRVSLSRS